MLAELFNLIPQDLKQQVLDSLVNVVSDQAKGLVGNEIATKIKKLRSDAAFHNTFEAGLKKAVKRFIEEYEALVSGKD